MQFLRHSILLVALSGLLAAAEAPVSAPTTLSAERFFADLSRDLAAHFGLEGELQLESLRPWSAPAGAAYIWRIEVIEYPSAAAASMLLRYRLHADNRVATADSTLVLRARHLRDVWAARVPLAVGTTFDPAQLEVRKVDILRERDVVPVTSGGSTHIMARSVMPGRLLTWRDITRRPLVKKGSVVEVAAVEGLLNVTLKALALENGAQGEIVTMRNPESHKNFAAVVIDENRVQVRF